MAKFNPAHPYNDLPPLPPAVQIETYPVLKLCIEARAALAALKQASTLIPNPGVLINTIPLLEAQASSEIENIVTTTDALFKYAQLAQDNADTATKEALRYRTALREGIDSLKQRPLSTSTAVKVCTTIKGAEMDIRKIPQPFIPRQRVKRYCAQSLPTGKHLFTKKPQSMYWYAWRLRIISSRPYTPSKMAMAAPAVC